MSEQEKQDRRREIDHLDVALQSVEAHLAQHEEYCYAAHIRDARHLIRRLKELDPEQRLAMEDG